MVQKRTPPARRQQDQKKDTSENRTARQDDEKKAATKGTATRRELLISIVGAAAAVLSAVGGWYGAISANKISSESLDLSKSSVELLLAHRRIPGDVHILFAIPKQAERIVVGSLPLYVVNTGAKTIETVNLQLVYPFRYLAATEALNKFFEIVSISGTKVQRHSQDLGGQLYITYTLGSLDPGTGGAISDPFSIQETTYTDTYTTSSGISIPYKVEFSWTMSAIVTATNTLSSYKRFSLAGIYASDKSSLVAHARELAKEQAKYLRGRLGFIRYFLSMLSGAQETYVVVFPDPKRVIAVPNLGSFIETYDEDLTFITANAYPFSLLF